MESFDPLNGGMKPRDSPPATPADCAALDPPRPTMAAALLLATLLALPCAALAFVQVLV
jgi:hypothetical protein